jgi:hypothetical protein
MSIRLCGESIIKKALATRQILRQELMVGSTEKNKCNYDCDLALIPELKVVAGSERRRRSALHTLRHPRTGPRRADNCGPPNMRQLRRSYRSSAGCCLSCHLDRVQAH